MLSQTFLNWKQARKWDNHCSKMIGKGENGKAKKVKKTKSFKTYSRTLSHPKTQKSQNSDFYIYLSKKVIKHDASVIRKALSVSLQTTF